jgi:hypothetical protein
LVLATLGVVRVVFFFGVVAADVVVGGAVSLVAAGADDSTWNRDTSA